MEIKASAKYLGVSPRKLRLLTKGLLGLSSKKALERLQFFPQWGTIYLSKVIKQAVANAKTNFKQEEDSLVIKRIEVGQGPAAKRMDKSHGARFDRGVIRKRTAHLFVTLEAKEVKPVVENKVINKLVKEQNTPVEANPPSLKLRRTRGPQS